MKRLLLALLLISPLAAAADRLILCGGSEVFIVEPDAPAFCFRRPPEMICIAEFPR